MIIIATIGPNSMDKKVLLGLIKNGVNVFRLNFSHFHEEEFTKVISYIKEINKDILIMGDLCGKKIRVYEGINNTYRIYGGEEVYFCGQDVYEVLCTNEIKEKIIPLTLNSSEITKNNIIEIFMKDGTMCFDVIDQNKGFIKAVLKKDGIVRAGKGCNIPSLLRGDMELSEIDKKNIQWALKNNLDIICQSYVETEKEINDVKDYIKFIGGTQNRLKFYSKIESPMGVKNCKNILEASDGIMIGRGDLVPECGIIKAVEDEIRVIKSVNLIKGNKDIVIATHVLDSMKFGNRATLPEVESIYNFIKLGVTGFMLASETSVCKTSIPIVCFLKELIDSYK